METIEFTYDKQNNIAYIDAHQSDFVPVYLKHLLSYLGIPAKTTLIFLKDQPHYKENKNESNT